MAAQVSILKACACGLKSCEACENREDVLGDDVTILAEVAIEHATVGIERRNQGTRGIANIVINGTEVHPLSKAQVRVLRDALSTLLEGGAL